MRGFYSRFLVSLGLILFAGAASATSLKEDLARGLVEELNGNPFGDEFKYENKEFQGDWSDRESWEGTLCDGYYSYGARLKGRVQELKAEIAQDLTIPISADINSIVVGLSGIYRSEWSLCAKLAASHAIRVDRAIARAVATVIEGKDGAPPVIKVRVLETRFGRIHFTEVLPDWLEEWLTEQINKGLRFVWNSRLGEWISDWLSEKLNEKFPGGGEN